MLVFSVPVGTDKIAGLWFDWEESVPRQTLCVMISISRVSYKILAL